MEEEILSRARRAESPEELQKLAKSSGRPMSAQRARELYDSWHREGLIEDDELDNVAGGCGVSKEKCPNCGKENITKEETSEKGALVTIYTYTCNDCKHQWTKSIGRH